MTELNYKYRLKGGQVIKTEIGKAELEALRAEAVTHKIGMRSCWNCNKAHERFLNDVTDNHLFGCFICNHFYFNGCDITEH